ncbi:hypothetical protein B0W47_07240 [Komagataeibacter nataicola]|uniref:Uncharacterized protein n=1 Tax=Komagataeibacter nataicola TaxID=265960 RepID=A0A9N7H120_9PROT|nr:hypothetical protein [Komagataeibacter nataicola]AQU87302.1 hypothetical protein B0W47_07240 [Komagataeibacter nataicola]PYD67432.1 hypothetical protein CDI09_02590 [Komagataeibacter nataicola]WEQ55804.1 hypothetical protein LV564_01425 [Komagataeibacter nataicola]WNM09331.1 hypothetical protein RI056_04955 [Komagataeibacter nataicola]GBR14988.1 hypothetical protein AA0616_0448 [Komagataeibacter nataicola NRIC 0616]
MRRPTRAGQAGPWRRFALLALLATVVTGGGLYLFIVTVDPWNILPFSPRLARIPVTSNARYTMPALARAPRFDSVIIGTSTSRLMQPAVLGPPLGAHFLNMAMNSASPWEQSRELDAFLRAHPVPRIIMIGIDAAWCHPRPGSLSGPNRPWPEWMYGHPAWMGYLHMASLYALQEAANEFWWLAGRKAQRFGTDGYTSFVPPDGQYDPARVQAIFSRWAPPDNTPAPPGMAETPPPGMDLLADMLARMPAATLRVVWFPPASDFLHGTPGSVADARLKACRLGVSRVTDPRRDTLVLDFNHDTALTGNRDNFWDPLHYRQPVARRVMADITAAIMTGHVDDPVVDMPHAPTPP